MSGNSNRLLTYIGIVLGILLISAGIGLLFTQHQSIQSATTVEGTVINTSSSANSVHTHPVFFDASGTSPHIDYQYSVRGVSHESTNLLSFGSSYYTMIPRQANSFTNNHPPGSSVTVYYSPNHPDQAFLLPQYAFLPNYLLIILGILIIGDAITAGSIVYFIAQMSFLSRSARVDIISSPTSENKASDSSQNTFTWGGLTLLCELVILHYFLTSTGPIDITAPIIGSILLIGFTVTVYRRWERQSYTV